MSCLYSTGHYSHSTSPPYTIFLKDPEPVLLISTSLPYNLQSAKNAQMCLPVIRILYNPLETQYQSVFSTVHYRPCSSTSYSLQSTTDTLPVLRILYNPQPTKFFRILYSPPQTPYQSSVYPTVHYRTSTSPPCTLQSTTDPEPVLRILYSPLQIPYQSSVYSTVNNRASTSPPYILQSTTDQVRLSSVPIFSYFFLFFQVSYFFFLHFNPFPIFFTKFLYFFKMLQIKCIDVQYRALFSKTVNLWCKFK